MLDLNLRRFNFSDKMPWRKSGVSNLYVPYVRGYYIYKVKNSYMAYRNWDDKTRKGKKFDSVEEAREWLDQLPSDSAPPLDISTLFWYKRNLNLYTLTS